MQYLWILQIRKRLLLPRIRANEVMINELRHRSISDRTHDW